MDTEAVEIDRLGRRVRVLGPESPEDGGGATETWPPHDKLILAQGGNPDTASPARSRFAVRVQTLDGPRRRQDQGLPPTRGAEDGPDRGGRFIGLEMAEAFRERGLATTGRRAPAQAHVDDGQRVRPDDRRQARGARRACGDRPRAQGDPPGRAGSRGKGRALRRLRRRCRHRPAVDRRPAGADAGEGRGIVDRRLGRPRGRRRAPDFRSADLRGRRHGRSPPQSIGRKVRAPLAGPANRQGRIAASNALGMRRRNTAAPLARACSRPSMPSPPRRA